MFEAASRYKLFQKIAISVHFLEKLEKTIGLRLGSDYRLFGDSLRFTT